MSRAKYEKIRIFVASPNDVADERSRLSLVIDKLNKEQHVIKQNLIIVEGVRDQLAEENSMLAQQVARYEDIIAELQNKEA